MLGVGVIEVNQVLACNVYSQTLNTELQILQPCLGQGVGNRQAVEGDLCAAYSQKLEATLLTEE